MRNKMSFLFAITGSALVTAFVIAINVLFSAGFPWSIFPVFAVLWWPLAVYSYHKKSPFFMSIVGSILSILFFIVVNVITSPGFPWSIFPGFALLWWPLALYSYNKKSPFFMSIAGSILSILFFIVVNVITSPGFPWSIFPFFALLWWPLGIYMYNKKSPLFLAIAGSVLSIFFFVVVNIITSPGFPWSIFPIFAVLWWPLAVYSYQKKSPLFLAIAGSILSILFFVAVNIITSPGFAWCIYPIFAVLWWPLSLFCGLNKRFTLLSVIGSILILALLFITELIVSTNTDWVFLVAFPVCLWPLSMGLKRYVRYVMFYLSLGTMTIVYYLFVNFFLFSGYPWSLYVAYGIIMAMMGSYFTLKQKGVWLLLGGLAVTVVFTIVHIFLIGKHILWIYELIYLIAVGQICVHLRVRKKYFLLGQFSIISVLLFLIINNILYSPRYLWVLYTVYPFISAFALMIFPKILRSLRFAVMTVLIGIAYYLVLNLVFAPGHLWVIYPAFALIWWPLALFYGKTRRHLAFAISGSVLTITFFTMLNLMTSPGVLWCIFPIFLVVWWPLSVYYFIYKKKNLIIHHH